MHKYNHRITWREFGKRISRHAGWTGRWPARAGRWHKRRLSKARRQAERSLIDFALGFTDHIRLRGFVSASRECNWKGW